MFINKLPDGRCNLCGIKLREYRQTRALSQRQVADLLQLHGLDIDKNAIQRIEAGKRFVTDIELFYLCAVFAVSPQQFWEASEK